MWQALSREVYLAIVCATMTCQTCRFLSGMRALELEGDELMGRMLQHEFDHLGGTLLLERLGKRERRSALRDLRDAALGIARAE